MTITKVSASNQRYTTSVYGSERGLMKLLMATIQYEAHYRDLPLFLMVIDTTVTLAYWREHYGFVQEMSTYYAQRWALYEDAIVFRFIDCKSYYNGPSLRWGSMKNGLRIFPGRDGRLRDSDSDDSAESKRREVVGTITKSGKCWEKKKWSHRFYFSYSIVNPTKYELGLLGRNNKLKLQGRPGNIRGEKSKLKRATADDPIQYIQSSYSTLPGEEKRIRCKGEIDADKLWVDSVEGKIYIQKQNPHANFADFSDLLASEESDDQEAESSEHVSSGRELERSPSLSVDSSSEAFLPLQVSDDNQSWLGLCCC